MATPSRSQSSRTDPSQGPSVSEKAPLDTIQEKLTDIHTTVLQLENSDALAAFLQALSTAQGALHALVTASSGESGGEATDPYKAAQASIEASSTLHSNPIPPTPQSEEHTDAST